MSDIIAPLSSPDSFYGRCCWCCEVGLKEMRRGRLGHRRDRFCLVPGGKKVVPCPLLIEGGGGRLMVVLFRVENNRNSRGYSRISWIKIPLHEDRRPLSFLDDSPPGTGKYDDGRNDDGEHYTVDFFLR